MVCTKFVELKITQETSNKIGRLNFQLIKHTISINIVGNMAVNITFINLRPNPILMAIAFLPVGINTDSSMKYCNKSFGPKYVNISGSKITLSSFPPSLTNVIKQFWRSNG